MKRLLSCVAIGMCALAIGCGGDDDAGGDGGNGDGDGGGSSVDATPTTDSTPALDAAEVCVGGATAAALLRAPSIGMVDGLPRIDLGGIVAGGPPQCNPVAQTGCQVGEKCASLTESDNPLLVRTTCVPDGNVAIGQMCTVGAPGPTTGFDDCQAGGHCLGGTCTEVCTQAPDSCPAESSCVAYSGLFDDLDGIGLCNPDCDVIEQNCCQDPNDNFGTGCYISLLTGGATCAPALPEANNVMPGVQGEDCMFLNTCAVGYTCSQINDPINATGNVCAKFCDPTMMGGPTCNDTGSADTCVIINGGFYGDATNVPMTIGFCVDCTVWADVPGCM